VYFLVRHAFLIAFVSALAWAIPSVAQTGLPAPAVEGDAFGPNEPQRVLKAGKVVHAVRVAAPPTIDGRLDDEPWIVAPAAVDLTQRDPDNGQAMTRATRIQFAYDGSLSVCGGHLPGRLRRRRGDGTGRRDELPPTENRDITLQAYVQPFIAVGDYSNVRKLALPYSYLFSPVTISYDPDFNTKSLRGNVVLRWEYVRGSTLFVVWMSRRPTIRDRVSSDRGATSAPRSAPSPLTH